MKKIFVKSTALLALGLSTLAWASAETELQMRLGKVEQLSANFEQTVSTVDGKNVQQGSGKLQIKRPNLFRLESKTPQENTIISDGKTLWFYDPFVEQATASWVKDAVNNTPFVLLTSTDRSHWQQYSVEQRGDTFVLKPKNKNSNIKQFDIRVNAEGILKGFSSIEHDGQVNQYVLRNITNENLAESLFKFSLPKGVQLDDQRKK